MNGSGPSVPAHGTRRPMTRSNANSGASQDILSLGVSVVLDFGLWARVERDEMRTVARRIGVGVELHYLNAPIDELWRRVETRNLEPPWDREPILPAHLVEWATTFQK